MAEFANKYLSWLPEGCIVALLPCVVLLIGSGLLLIRFSN